ncbi:MAG: sensor histidine kinase [Actinomycetota bacterium]
MVEAAVIGAIVGAIVGAATTTIATRVRARTSSAELTRVQASLAESERIAARADEVRGLIDSAMQEGVLLFDGSGQLVFTNEASGRLLARRPTSLPLLFPAAAAEAATDVATTRTPRVVEVETVSPARWLRFAATPAGDGGVLVVISDVTDARRLDAVRRDFVANASHELKTPAASIRAAAETLLDAIPDDPDSVTRFARTLEGEAERLSRIVADLLDLSRLEAGGEPVGTVRLDALVTEETGRFADRARDAELRLDVRTEPVPAVRGSERDLALMVANLIDNAIRYTPGGGTVDVLVDPVDGRVRVRIVDSGIGIPQRDLRRVQERFYRVDRGRSRQSGGTGLGLSIVRHVAENHGGSVSVQSEVGRGTTVEVVLPVAGPA